MIGGGAIGTSTAYHLTKLGVTDVVLLERKELTAGTTWHAAGLITSAGMPTETYLWMSRYTTELLPTLTAETGQDTGFRTIGHLHLACTPQRLETVTREAIFAKAHGVPVEMVGPEEVGRHWPSAKVDDILAAAWVPDEGRANPADVAQAYAKGARAAGAKIVEGVTVTGFTTANGAVTGVETDHGTIETETVVVAAGMWGRQLGALAGVSLPLQAAEHYYLLTDEVEWAHPDLPVVEDPDRYGYYREEGGGMLVGLFEPKAAPWSLDTIPQDLGFAVLPPDWDRMAGFLSDAMDRFPSLHDAGIRQFFCGPESFTSDNGPLLGEVPELRGFFAACGLNSLGILLSGGAGSMIAQWIVDGEPPLEVTGISPDRLMPFMATRAFREQKTVELLGTLFGDAAFPSWRPWTARGARRSPIHDRLTDAGADFVVLTGYEVPEWFAPEGVSHERPQGWLRDQSFDAWAKEHGRCARRSGSWTCRSWRRSRCRGPDALDAAQPCERERARRAGRQDHLHALVHTERQDLDGPHGDPDRRGHVPRDRGRRDPPADARVARASARRGRGRDRHRHDELPDAPHGARATVAGAPRTSDHRRPLERGLPLYAGEGDRGGHGPRVRDPRDLPR